MGPLPSDVKKASRKHPQKVPDSHTPPDPETGKQDGAADSKSPAPPSALYAPTCRQVSGYLVLSTLVFLATLAAFSLIDKNQRKQFIISAEERWQQKLYEHPPSKIAHVTQDHPPWCSQVQFGTEFLWGTTSAATQIEGAVDEDGRSPSIWDVLGGNSNGDTPTIAADHYHRWREDVALLKSYGVRAYKFSLSWPRIRPNATAYSPPNPLGLAFYHNLTDALLAAGITPIATLYHWDLPDALEDPKNPQGGGWLDPQTVFHFKAYAELVFREFGGKIKHWVTFEEPWTICQMGYAGTLAAPARTNGNPYRCGHHVLLSHMEAVRSYRDAGIHLQGGRIGMVLNGDFMQPMVWDNWDDIEAVERLNSISLGWFLDPIFLGHYPAVMRDKLGPAMPTFTPEQMGYLRGSVDFIGLNHFTTRWGVHDKRNWEVFKVSTTQYDWKGKPIGETTGSGWLQSVPWGMYRMLKYVDHRYNHPAIWITSNGVSTLHEDTMSDAEAVADTNRTQYFKDYINEMCHAMVTSKVNVEVYLAYTFLDGFEWRRGYTERFGITRVNFTTSKVNPSTYRRTPKSSAMWLSSFWTQAAPKVG